MHGKGNIEDFLKSKLTNLDNPIQDDWSLFEQKLKHSLYLQRLKRVLWLGSVCVVLAAVFLSVKVYHVPDSDPYLPEREIQLPPFREEVKAGKMYSNEVLTFRPAAHKAPGKAPLRKERYPLPRNTRVKVISGIPASPYEKTGEEADHENTLLVNSPGFAYQAPVLLSRNLRMQEENSEGDETAFFFSLPDPSLLDPPYLAIRTPTGAKRVEKIAGPYVSPLQEQNPWGYSLNVYPNFTYRKLIVDESKLNLLHRDFIDAVQAAESGGFSLNVGFEVSRRIGRITFLNSGVEYMSYNTQAVYDFKNFREAHINPESGVIENYTLKEESEIIAFTDRNSYHYINIPLSIAHQPWATDHIRLNMEVGGSYMYFVTAKGKTLNYKTLDIVDLSTRDFKKNIGSFFFKVGANYYVSSNINVGFEPTIMYFTNTIYSDDYPFKVVPYSIGLNFNLQVKLN